MKSAGIHLFLATIFFAFHFSRADDAPPAVINLGRTSLASVTASSVNGERAMDNPFCGVTNAFDDGKNRVNDMDYTSWEPDYGGPETYVEVRFDVPVTVAEIIIEKGRPFTAHLFGEDDAEQVVKGDESAAVHPVAAKISRVQIYFEPDAQHRIEVQEIKIMGMVPAGIKYTVGVPRVVVSDRNMELEADGAYWEWLSSYAGHSKHKTVRQEGDKTIFVYFLEDVPVMRVTVDHKTGNKKVEIISAKKPIMGEKPPPPTPPPTPVPTPTPDKGPHPID